MITRGSARGQQAAQTAPNSVPEVAQAKTSAIVKRSGTFFLNRPSRLTGATQVTQEKRAVAEGQWATTPSTTANLGGTHVVVIKGLLPDAESLMKDERDTWEYTLIRTLTISVTSLCRWTMATMAAVGSRT